MNANKPKGIEDLANAIKFDFEKYRKTEISRFKSDLASALLSIIHLKDFSVNNKGNLKKDSQLSQSHKVRDYNGEVFTKAFKSALESYGKVSEKTGERIPFKAIFLSHYTIKKPQVRVERYEEDNYKVETKLKNNTIKLFLQQQAKKLANKKLPSDLKIEKIDDCILFLRNLNADNEETEKVINKLTDLFTDRYVQRIRPVSDNNDNENMTTADFVEDDDNLKEAVIDKIADGLDWTISEIEKMKDKSLLEYAKYYITMKIILKYKVIGFDNQIIDEYVDKGLEKFYYEKYGQYIDEKYIKDIVADYVGKKPDTVRKKIKRVKIIIQNSMLKNMARR